MLQLLLRELKIGDRFYCLNDKKKTKWVVHTDSEFNIRHGFSTRYCMNEATREIKSKSGRLKIIKFEK